MSIFTLVVVVEKEARKVLDANAMTLAVNWVKG